MNRNKWRSHAKGVAEEADRNLERVRSSDAPLVIATDAVGLCLREYPETIAEASRCIFKLGTDETLNFGLRIIANQLRRCADMLDLAVDRAEKEGLSR